jgi:hypothetical protein
MSGFPVRSLPAGTLKHAVALRFLLTQADISELEQRRHSNVGATFSLYSDVEPTVAVIATSNGHGVDGSWQPSPFDPSFGMHAELQPFWNAGIRQLQVQMEPSASRLRDEGVIVSARYAKDDRSTVTGYRVALKSGPGEPPLWFGGGTLGTDLRLPALRSRWQEAGSPPGLAV